MMVLFVYIKDIKISIKMSGLYTLYLFVLYSFYEFFSDERYEICLDVNIDDKVYSSYNEVVFILTLLHILILVNVGIIKKKYF